MITLKKGQKLHATITLSICTYNALYCDRENTGHVLFSLPPHAMLKSIAVCFVGLVITDRVGKRRNRIVLAGELQAIFSSFLEATTTLLALNL
jgi:hypothetical protein